jgi:cellobiose phosphorylase
MVSVNEDVDRFRSITHRAIVRRAASVVDLDSDVCTSRREYVGHTRASLAQARCLRTGCLTRQVALTVFTDQAVAADLHRFELRPGASARFDYILSLVSTQAALDEERRTPIRARLVDQAWRRVCTDLKNAPHSLRMHVSESARATIEAEPLNRFFPFLKRQVEVCARTDGYMQPSPNSLIGFRDVLQAIEGHLYDDADAARAKICEALSFVLPDGQCPRQYTLPAHGRPGQCDLREFIDQGAWAISALHTYVAVTGDAQLLSETLEYHRRADHQSTRLVPAGDHDSVLEHLIRIMSFLDRHRDRHTGLVRALYGDWNDAVDGLGTSNDDSVDFGSGVSVMASLQFYRNCHEMIELLERFYPGQYLDLVRHYRETRGALQQSLLQHAVAERDDDRRIVHGWGDKQRYYVGSFQDSDDQPRDSLTSNAFWVLAGMLEHDPGLRTHILAAMQRLDSLYGLRTFWPGFAPDAPGVGRVVKLPIGTAENGASYVHATAFGIMALFALGEPQSAWRQIEKILPFAPHQTGLSHSSFVLPNCYVHNPELNLGGQNMNDWQTGSSNVLLKLLIRYVFGFRPQMDELVVAPATWRPFDQLDFSATAHGHRIRIRTKYADVPDTVFQLNGQTIPGRAAVEMRSSAAHIPYERLRPREINFIEVVQPRPA